MIFFKLKCLFQPCTGPFTSSSHPGALDFSTKEQATTFKKKEKHSFLNQFLSQATDQKSSFLTFCYTGERQNLMPSHCCCITLVFCRTEQTHIQVVRFFSSAGSSWRLCQSSHHPAIKILPLIDPKL